MGPLVVGIPSIFILHQDLDLAGLRTCYFDYNPPTTTLRFDVDGRPAHSTREIAELFAQNEVPLSRCHVYLNLVGDTISSFGLRVCNEGPPDRYTLGVILGLVDSNEVDFDRSSCHFVRR